jgi:hypothetical protein
MENKINLESSLKFSDDIGEAISDFSDANSDVEFFRILEKSTDIFMGFIFYFFMVNSRTFEEFKNAINSSIDTFKKNDNVSTNN